jgi:hypothetical protein
VLDPFFAGGAQCVAGVDRNEIAKLLWSEQALNSIEQAQGRGNVVVHSLLHFNFS